MKRLTHLVTNIVLISSLVFLLSCSTDDNDIKAVKLLLQQFQYGVAAKDELLDKCIELGWIKIN